MNLMIPVNVKALLTSYLRTFSFIILLGIISACTDSIDNHGRSFRMAVRAEPPTLDWSLATDSISFNILTNLMEGLTQYNADLEAVPAVAKRWEFSENGRVITFYLRDDVFWSDGKPVTAHDFEYSWKRLLNPATAAQYAYFLFDIENAAEYNSGKITDPAKVGVRAVTPTVLEVKLKKPVVYFPSIVTFMVTFPMREDIVERYGDLWTEPGNIVTNGPFTLDEWKHEYKLILKANDRHYEGRPAIDTVLIYVVEEPTTALTLYETGELDILELPPVAIPHYKNSPDYRSLPQLRGYYYGFNVEKPPFDDVRVRQAFSHAVDRSQIPIILQGGEIPTSSWIPKGMFGYNPDIGPKFNPEKARRLLADAGYPEGKGFPVTQAMFNTESRNRLIAEFLQAQWKQHLNVDIEFESQEWKVFLSRLQMDPPPLFRLGWGADFPDPDNFMNLFISTSGNNRLRWANSRYDELVAKGPVIRDPKQRQALYDEAQTLLTEIDTAMISLFIQVQNLLIKPHIKGLEMNSMELLYIKRIHLDQRDAGLNIDVR
ncbi:MAG: peptide ABC transporter substrate-binding protein [Nitrospinae bacterium]|jgi:oligopeptide transport system substrate-binding protein|nr:peptide ABC transporter substrate-binding protein [Nitrospinota bacterium]